MADDRIYEMLHPNDHSQWNGNSVNGSKIVRSRNMAPQRSLSGGDAYYSTPRMANGTFPPPRTQPPSIPPRNRQPSDGEGFISGSFGSSPSDRGLFIPGRRTPSIGITKSPSVHSVNSTHSSSTGVEELALNDFMLRYSKNLPLRVTVCKGYYGECDSTAVTTGDILNLHFVKKTKVMLIEVTDPDQGIVKFSVPLNSSLKFSPLYDPRNKIEEAKRGFKFETVGDILAAKVMPKVVRATKPYTGGSSDNSVAENEILFIRNSKNKFTGKQLRVFSITNKRKKTLSENCAGHFTTNPTQLLLPLCDLTTSMEDCFPLKALLMVGRDALDTVLTDLQGEIVTMTKVVTEQSVIATNHSDDGDDGCEDTEIAEMPFDLDIEVEALALEDHDTDRLRQETSHMHDTFDPYSVRIYQTKPTSRLYDIQCHLYKTTTGVNDFRGLEIVRPLSITKRAIITSSAPPSASSSAPTTPNTQMYQSLVDFDEKKCQDYYIVMTPKRRSKSQEETGSGSDHSEDSGISQRSQMSAMEQWHKNTETNMNKMMEEITRLKSKTEHLTRRCDSLQAQLRMVNGGRSRDFSESSSGVFSESPPSMDSRPPAPLPRDVLTRSPTPVEEPGTYHIIGEQERRSSSPAVQKLQLSNEEFLSAMNHQQVLDLLDVMGMKQYQEKFQQEQVNGEILAECDEDVLTKDLGVSSRLHRMRLLKIISGRHSARCILAGEDPYPKKKEAPLLLEGSH